MHKTTAVLLAAAVIGSGALPAAAQPPRDRASARERATAERQQSRDRDQREELTERFTRTLKVGANGEIHLANVAGDVTIARGSGSEATIEVLKVARARTSDEARQMLELVSVEISERGGRGDVKVRYPHDEFRRNNRRNINVSVSFNVVAPAGTGVSVHSVSGSVSAKDIKGDLNLETVSGTVRIHGGGRVGTAKSVSGNVEIVDTDSDGEIAASSVSGTVLLRNVKTRDISVDSVSGNVVLQDVSSNNVEAQTVSGEAEFTGALARNGRYELTSHSGSVRVTVAGSGGFEIEATSFSGEVRTDLPLKSRSSEGSRRLNRTLRGVYGDGSAFLEVTTFSGNIVIAKR